MEPEPVADDPNDRYISDLYAWSSVSDVDTFFSKFNHDSGYKDGNIGLSVGDRIVIKDGTYNATWIIAGFDMEHNQKAADGIVYDNGYGICMIPVAQVTTDRWAMGTSVNGAYKSSAIHSSALPTVVTNLKNILGDHIVNRNVLLSNNVYRDTKLSYSYMWTTAYATLMSVGQMTGKFAANSNKYDDGEANYKLPLFNYEDYKTGSNFWTRGIGGANGANQLAAMIGSDGRVINYLITYAYGVRPLIYLR